VLQQGISVIICAYSEQRWPDLQAALDSIKHQTLSPLEIIVVVDHNANLLQSVRALDPNLIAIENQGPRGLSSARNTGVARARGTLFAFIDDDACADPDWLGWLNDACADPRVLGVGGHVEPAWWSSRPRWFPEEFDWVVGCSYPGLPYGRAPIRNLIGTNMLLKREIFELLGGFAMNLGRVGTLPLGCEETEICIRAHQQWPDRFFLYDSRARVTHRVTEIRGRLSYFVSRCYAEGYSKASVARLVGTVDGLMTEREYTRRVLPIGVLQGIADMFRHGDVAGLGRSMTIILGLGITTLGYVLGCVNVSSGLSRLFGQGAASPDFEPIKLLTVDFGQEISMLPALFTEERQTFRHATALVRFHGQPLGLLDLEDEEVCNTSSKLAEQIWQAFAEQIVAHLRQDGFNITGEQTSEALTALGATPCPNKIVSVHRAHVTVIVSTRDRPIDLEKCLDALLTLDYPDYEIIVVDNAPQTEATAALLALKYGKLPHVRYVREERPGLSFARNRGITEAHGEILAFTDDDAIVDRMWLMDLVRGFDAAPKVGCVTGLTLPLELASPEQFWFEQTGGFAKGFVRRVFDLSGSVSYGPLYPYAAGQFGSGVNMAMTATALRDIGGFNPALGAGTPTHGGEDLAAYLQVLQAGYALVYEPAALVRHRHRRDYSGLRKQLFGTGVGLTAYLTKCVVDDPQCILIFARRVLPAMGHMFGRSSAKNVHKMHGSFPLELVAVERLGLLLGPLAYWRSLRRIRHRSVSHT